MIDLFFSSDFLVIIASSKKTHNKEKMQISMQTREKIL